jgi:excisionase family DNA binding protein
MSDHEKLLEKNLLRINEAAELLEVHENTVRRWITDGKLVGVTTPGNQRRVKTESMKRYL